MNVKYLCVFLCLLFLSCLNLKSSPERISPVSKDFSSIATSETVHENTGHYELLRSGSNSKSGIDQIIRDQGRLDNLYAILYGSRLKAPKIDFSSKAVVVITSGPFSTGGYGIELISVIKTGNSIELVWGLIRPSPQDIVTQAITSPYSIFAVDAESNDNIVLKCNDNLNLNDKLNRLYMPSKRLHIRIVLFRR